ncbi:MAG: hypothetical protein ACI81Y_002780 [Glaciecola sp.]|jgi:hypothetical protein
MKKIIIFTFCLLVSSFGIAQDTFFDQADTFFKKYVMDNGVDYKTLSSSRESMKPLMDYIANSDYSSWGLETQKAYLINAYNILVISKLKNNYPVKSPMDIPAFFDSNSELVNGEQISLNHLEKSILFGLESDPRFHFVLVCGAKGCPPIAIFAYRPSSLEEQLESQTSLALNDDLFVKYNEDINSLGLSKIFEWYAKDFGGKKKLINYINTYRTTPVSMDANVYHYDYDWSINATKSLDTGTNVTPNTSTGPTVVSTSTMKKSDPISTEMAPAQKKSNVQTYTPSVLLKKGQKDITWFNTIYTQNRSKWKGEESSGFRETFYTSLLQLTYGVSRNARLNVGLDINFKSSGATYSDSTFSNIDRAFEFTNTDTTRVGLASIAVRMKYALSQKRHLSLESSFAFPTAKNPEGNLESDGTNPYFLDWERFIWWNRFYYDKTFAGKYQIFAEADLLFRIKTNSNQNSALDTPVSIFFSYFLNNKTSVYAMSQHVWRFRHSSISDDVNDDITTPANYTVYGFGGKYQLGQKLNLELLFTDFFRSKNAGLGETYNLGLKYIFN